MAKLNVVIPANEVTVGGDKYRKVERAAVEGDIVKITDTDIPSFVIHGAFYEVKRIDSYGDPRIIDEDGDEYDLAGVDFEVYEKVTQTQAPQYREVKRPAKEGERIRIVNAKSAAGYYSDGDELIVENADRWNDGEAVTVTEFNFAILHEEYVVLEPVESEEKPSQPERLKVGEYAKVIEATNGYARCGEIVEIVEDDASRVPFRIDSLSGEYRGWVYEKSLVRVTEAEVAAAKEEYTRTQEIAKWAAIGRKVGEYKAGDIVQYTDDEYGEVVPVLSVDGEYVEVQTVDCGVCTENACDMKLIVPVEQRFDLAEGGERGETPSK